MRSIECLLDPKVTILPVEQSDTQYRLLTTSTIRACTVQYCSCSMNLLQFSSNSLPSSVNRLGLKIRLQSYPNDLAFSLVSASIC
jgi:hypothetical protein